MSIAEITLKKKVKKKLKKKMVDQELSAEEGNKVDTSPSAKEKEFVAGQMEVFIKPKKKSKRNKRPTESELWMPLKTFFGICIII